MYARFRSRSVFYKRRDVVKSAYGARPNSMRVLNVKRGLLRGTFADETVNLNDRSRLELLESLRHPRERDFYQDHTYHNQWVQRDLDRGQKQQLSSRYRFMLPGFVKTPWIWFPGDMVEVVSGDCRGVRGTIIAVMKYKNEIVVQNVNVQDVTIPATETRPEQIVQREHPISVDLVRHVDPQTNEMCTVRLVTVRNRETGVHEEKRISLDSGVLMPIPPREDGLETGDPLKDTPIQDADEPTYDANAEISVLVERKLRAIEDHFVGRLKRAHMFHNSRSRSNAAEMVGFQEDVVTKATEAAVAALESSLSTEWWHEELDPMVADLRQDAIDAAAAASAANSAAAAAEGDASEGDVEEVEEEEDEGDFLDASAPGGDVSSDGAEGANRSNTGDSNSSPDSR